MGRDIHAVTEKKSNEDVKQGGNVVKEFKEESDVALDIPVARKTLLLRTVTKDAKKDTLVAEAECRIKAVPRYVFHILRLSPSYEYPYAL